MDGRIIGTLTATGVLVVLWYAALGLFTSLPGLLIAGIIAAMAGSAAGVLAEPRRSRCNAATVVGYIGMLILAYMLVGETAGRYAPPGLRGDSAVMPLP